MDFSDKINYWRRFWEGSVQNLTTTTTTTSFISILSVGFVRRIKRRICASIRVFVIDEIWSSNYFLRLQWMPLHSDYHSFQSFCFSFANQIHGTLVKSVSSLELFAVSWYKHVPKDFSIISVFFIIAVLCEIVAEIMRIFMFANKIGLDNDLDYCLSK